VVTSGPYPADKNGNSNTNAARKKPYDAVLADSDLVAIQTPVVVGSSTFSSGLVADTRVYTPISDLAPAQASDSGATNMQHMAVVKDFMISEAVTPAVTVVAPNGGERWPAGGSQSISWTAARVENVRLEVSLDDGGTWSTIATVPASSGIYDWTLPQTASAAAQVRVSDSTNSSVQDTSDGSFAILPAVRVIINEILANEPGSNVAGEFVEVLNAGTGSADLGGWTLSDGTSVRHVFASGTSLPAGKAIVVFGGAKAIPPNLTNAVAASTGALGLGNGGDTVALADASSATVDTFTYPSSLSSTDGVSMNRSTDGVPETSFVLHTQMSALSSSPGRRTDGTDW
jgi:hypothetical protein